MHNVPLFFICFVLLFYNICNFLFVCYIISYKSTYDAIFILITLFRCCFLMCTTSPFSELDSCATPPMSLVAALSVQVDLLTFLIESSSTFLFSRSIISLNASSLTIKTQTSASPTATAGMLFTSVATSVGKLHFSLSNFLYMAIQSLHSLFFLFSSCITL